LQKELDGRINEVVAHPQGKPVASEVVKDATKASHRPDHLFEQALHTIVRHHETE
jgi:hypothetical protein